jgi:hypothetical protein
MWLLKLLLGMFAPLIYLIVGIVMLPFAAVCFVINLFRPQQKDHQAALPNDAD